MDIEGVTTALITPMHKDGEVNYEGLIVNIGHQIEADVDAILVLGTTGEAPTLSQKEQEKIIEIAAKESHGKIPLIVGCGTYSTKSTIENIHQAEKLGAAAALIVTPYYNCPTQEGLQQHFNAIFKATDLPIILYNVPKRCGRALSIETMELIAQQKNVIAIKEATGDMGMIQSTISLAKKYAHLCVLSGDDVLTLPMMSLGAKGVISVVSNLFPREVVELVRAANQGNFQRALEIHDTLLDVFQAAFIETNPIPIKAMMEHTGLAAGPCRLPLCNLREDNFQKVQKVLARYTPCLQMV